MAVRRRTADGTSAVPVWRGVVILDTHPFMAADVLVSVASLAGVGLGGGLSYLAQITAQRQAGRTE
jgi:hypothetical protein